MITMTTDKGTTHEVRYMLNTARDADKLVISLEDNRSLAEIAGELEGCKSIKAKNSDSPGRTELYDGYTELTAIQRLDGGAVRVTLTKP